MGYCLAPMYKIYVIVHSKSVDVAIRQIFGYHMSKETSRWALADGVRRGKWKLTIKTKVLKVYFCILNIFLENPSNGVSLRKNKTTVGFSRKYSIGIHHRTRKVSYEWNCLVLRKIRPPIDLVGKILLKCTRKQ